MIVNFLVPKSKRYNQAGHTIRIAFPFKQGYFSDVGVG